MTSAKQKVELWRYNSNLVFKNGEVIVSCGDDRPGRWLMLVIFKDLDLLDEHRSLLYFGNLLRSDSGLNLKRSGRSEVFVLLLDNYRG